MTTYKQFLIHPNLRCYYDNRGNLEPKFVHTEFKTIEEAKARIDKYWDEWQQFEASRKKVDLARSFQILKADMDLHDEAQELEADKFNEKVEEYFDNLLNEDHG